MARKKALTALQLDDRLRNNELRKAHGKRIPKPVSKEELNQGIKLLIETITPIVNQLRADRDKLRAVLDEYQNVLDCTERGCENLEEAVDALSEQF